MLQDKKIEDQIQSYIDGEISAEERSFIEKMIAGDKTWNQSYEDLLAIHYLLNENLETMEPSMRFTKNVMDEVAAYEIAKPIRLRHNPWLFRIAGGVLGSLLLGIIVYMFSLFDFTTSDSGSSLPIPEIDFPKISWTNYLGGNANIGLFMLCTILGLVILDKYLSAKKKAL